ncbi:nicotinate-nucleotide--dimethylbenzimidazole phosphoribosyltransferase [Kordiimonas sp.]|uniref:nicotinate-nucleotide--dimethylbenzimidazole phosphoribosyltransferase n=1 Tax=Kordiimonas sp. TaxID=1970157 RepID=UPI003A956787
MLTGQPFDDLRTIVSQLPDADDDAANAFVTACEMSSFTEDRGLVELGAWMAAWQGRANPASKDTHICILASSYKGSGKPEDVLGYVAATAKGRAPVNLLCVDQGIGLRALELAPQLPHDPNVEWREADCMGAVAFGMEAAASEGDVLGLTAYAPGGDVRALSVLVATGALKPDATENTSSPLGQMLAHPTVAAVAPCAGLDPLEAMQQFGGREIAGAVGAIIATRSKRLPMLAEGWAALAAMVVLRALRPGSTDHVMFSAPDSPALKQALEQLNFTTLISQPVGVGPGCAVALALPVLKAACQLPSMPALE